MTVETAASTHEELRRNLMTIDIEMPTELWYDVRTPIGGLLAAHRFSNCRKAQAAASTLGFLERVWRPVTQPPWPSSCWDCETRSGGALTLNRHKLATARTKELLDCLLSDELAAGAVLAALTRAHRAWFDADNAARGADASEPSLTAQAARRQMGTLTDTARAMIRMAQVEAKASHTARSIRNELRYYSACLLSSRVGGCLAWYGLAAPIPANSAPPFLGEMTLLNTAFQRFCRELRRAGNVRWAQDTAKRTLTHTARLAPDWIDEHVETWVRDLEQVEAEQADAGNVTLRLPPMDSDMWGETSDLLLLWTDEIHDDGGLTMTVSAVLAEQIWRAYGDATLLPSSENDKAQIAMASRFWHPGGTERLVAVLATAHLIAS